MKNSGWNASRRNRNIGTKKSGHGQDNSLVIPESWTDDRLFHEKLRDPVSYEIEINGNPLVIMIEGPQPGFLHSCTPDDIEYLLKLIPEKHLKPIQMIVLRQPKKKEQILSPVWGRLRYWSDIKQYSGPAIHLEAQPLNNTFRWSKSLMPDDSRELERLKSDGHRVESDRRYYYITGDHISIRNTQLYRTLPHEIGHYVDYLESVEYPAGDDDDKYKYLDDLYFKKPGKDKEDFANRYAEEFFEQQKQNGVLPFERAFNSNSLREKGLDPTWFGSEN